MKSSVLVACGLTSLLFSCSGDSVTIGGPDGSADAPNGIDGSANDGSTEASSDDGSVGDAPTGNDGPLFDPGSVSGLVLWLDANKGITQSSGTVSAWADKTANKNDASQGTALRQPTFQAASINGRPAVHFNKDHGGANKGDVLAIADAVSLQWGTGDFYVVVVARFNNVTSTDGPGLFFDKSFGGTPSGQTVLFVGGVPSQLNGGTAADGALFSTRVAAGDYVKSAKPYNDGTPHAFAMQRVGTMLDLRVDAASHGTSASAGVDVSNVGGGLAAGKVLIGADYDATGFRLNGDIAEVLAVKGVLTSGARAGLEGYLKAKYGL